MMKDKNIEKTTGYRNIQEHDEVTFRTVDDILAYYGSRQGSPSDYSGESSDYAE